jgi:hypothetical protein
MSLRIAPSPKLQKLRNMAATLQNAREPARTRHLAAVALARLDSSAARDVLVRSLRIRDRMVRDGVLRALGRIGDEAALRAIARLKDSSARARFAAALLAQRLGAKGHDLRPPRTGGLLALGAQSCPVKWQQPAAAELKSCLRSLAGDPFGIAFARAPAYQVRCGGQLLMVILNRKLAAQDMVDELCSHKTLAGVVAARNDADGRYSVTLLILTAPSRRPPGFRLLLCQPNGTIAYAGLARAKAGAAEFSLRAISRPGAVPIRVEGTLEGAKVKIKSARSALSVYSPRQPRKVQQ